MAQVGYFLRQFKRTGDVPLALKNAILWQPKSWASIRKVLLAPPGERISMPGQCYYWLGLERLSACIFHENNRVGV